MCPKVAVTDVTTMADGSKRKPNITTQVYKQVIKADTVTFKSKLDFHLANDEVRILNTQLVQLFVHLLELQLQLISLLLHLFVIETHHSLLIDNFFNFDLFDLFLNSFVEKTSHDSDALPIPKVAL